MEYLEKIEPQLKQIKNKYNCESFRVHKANLSRNKVCKIDRQVLEQRLKESLNTKLKSIEKGLIKIGDKKELVRIVLTDVFTGLGKSEKYTQNIVSLALNIFSEKEIKFTNYSKAPLFSDKKQIAGVKYLK